jgi:hypothetical protein
MSSFLFREFFRELNNSYLEIAEDEGKILELKNQNKTRLKNEYKIPNNIYFKFKFFFCIKIRI